jgi:hypothetical protein
MSQSDIKFGINNCLNDITFNKEYYSVYNNVFNDRIILTYELFIFFILQISLKNKFNGYFDELYKDVIKRQSEYLRELINNFKTSYIGEETFYKKIYKKFFKKSKMTEQEIYFHRKIHIFDFDSVFNDYFGLNDNKKKLFFITTCQKIYEDKIKIKKEVEKLQFVSSKIICT